MAKNAEYEVPGNVIATQAAYAKFVDRAGQGWIEFVGAVQNLAARGVLVDRVTMKGEWHNGGDMLVVLAARTEAGYMVAFHNVEDPSTMWVALANRIKNGSLKWRDDEYRA